MIRIQWRRVAPSVQKVDLIGVLSRMYGLKWVVRCTYSVRGPLSLWHVDTNHKLIKLVEIHMQNAHFVLKAVLNKHNTVSFGAVDEYSRKIREVWCFLPSLKLSKFLYDG